MEAFIDRFTRICRSKALAWLIIVNISVFLVVWAVIFIGNAMGVSGNFTLPWLSLPSGLIVYFSRPWTALTYMVTQYDFLHLLFNTLWLYWFGIMLAPVLEGRQILYLYVAGGLSGAVAWLGFSTLWPDGSGCLCGASASVMSVMSAVSVISPNHRVSLFLFGRVKLIWIAAGCIVLTFAGTTAHTPGAAAAHAAGVLAGVIYALACVRTKNKPLRKPLRKKNRNGMGVADILDNRRADHLRLDELLDKIRISGYRSLTPSERNELEMLSRKPLT